MKSNQSLQLKVANQLQNDIILSDAEVTLDISKRDVVVQGKVNKFFKKGMVCKMVHDVTGIKNVIDRISVVLTNPEQFTDEEILKTVLEKFEKNFGSSYKNIEVTVNNGSVTLEGTLKWNYQKLLATECITYIEGIVSIQNNLLVSATATPLVTEKDILAAIYKEESVTSDISIDLNGRCVTLTGKVNSNFQKKLIEKIVHDVPGVQEVESKLQVVKKSKL